MGHISIGGWFLGATALFDVLDGTVARRSNKSSTFGAFLDSTLDRVADGALLGGLGGVLCAESRPPQRADGCGVSRWTHRRLPDVVHPRARRSARPRRQGRHGAAARAHRVAVGSTGVLRSGAQRVGAGRHHRFPHRHGVDHRRAAHGHFVYQQTNDARRLPRRIALPTEKTFWLRRRRRTGTRHSIERRVIRGFVSSAIRPASGKLGILTPGSARSRRRSWPASRAFVAAIPSRSARSRRWRRFASASARKIARR